MEKNTLNPKWEKPDLNFELHELIRTGVEIDISVTRLIAAFEQGKLQELQDVDWERALNCDSSDTGWTIEEVRAHLDGVRDFARIEHGLRSGATLPAPIMLFRQGERPYFIAGNSRLLGCRALGLRPTVFALRI